MECHRCPHNGQSSTACLSCGGPPDTNHRGQTFLSINASQGSDGQTFGEVEATLSPKRPFERAECLEIDVEDVDNDRLDHDRSSVRSDHQPESEAVTAARAIAYAFTSLTELEFYLVQRLMRGENMAQIGKRQGMTRAAISARVKKLVEKHPAFRFLRLEG